jgi:hypothetical protein
MFFLNASIFFKLEKNIKEMINSNGLIRDCEDCLVSYIDYYHSIKIKLNKGVFLLIQYKIGLGMKSEGSMSMTP